MIQLFKVACNVDGALENLKAVLSSGYVGQGKFCDQFERDVAAMLGHQRALYLNSCTSSIQLALHLAGAGPGTEVVSTPITCLATNSSIVANGAKIVWADVDKRTGNLDLNDAARKVTHRTRAIIGVDWGGRLVRFDELRKKVRGVTLIEDAAHAFGSIGANDSRGDMICYSFQAIKLLNTADGGALVTPSAALHERAKLLRWFGLDRTRSDAMRCYQPVSEVGWKFQGNDVLASIGCANLSLVKESLYLHQKNAAWYYDALSLVPYIRLPEPDPASSWWLYTIQVSNPAAFETFMAAQGVMVSPAHARNDLYECFRAFRSTDLPGVDEFAGHQVNIPVGWWLTDSERDAVVAAVRLWSSQPEARWDS